jgi:hypothetical protein
MARVDLGRLRFYYQGVYSGSTEYELNDVVRYGNSVYVYKYSTASTGNAPTNATYWDRMVPGLDYKGAWAGTTVYYIDDVVSRGGQLYIAILSHTSGSIFADDLSASKWELFTGGTRWRGEYATSTAYLKNDLVYYGTNTYIADTDFTSNSTSFDNDTNWTLFALGADIPSQASNSGAFLSTNGSSLVWAEVDAFPSQTNNAGKVLVTDGTNVSWSATVNELTANVGNVSATSGNVIAQLGIYAANNTFTVDGASGNTIIPGTLDVTGNSTFIATTYHGANAESFANTAALTNPVVVFDITDDDYSQVVIHNASNGANASSDYIAYTDDGDDTSGWIDMGITSSNFSDPGFTITGAHDGYIFMEAPINASGQGNLVFATGENGTQNKIIFAAGGLQSDNTQMEITPDVNVHIEIPTPSTSPTTGALTVVGGVGIQGDVYIEGTIVFGGGGTTVETSNLNVTDPFVFVGSGNQADTVDLAFIGEYATSISTITKSIDNKVLTNNVATLSTTTAHTFLEGDVVVVTDVDATFNGTYSITAVTTNTFSYSKTASNVSSTAVSPNGTAEVSARRKFSGVARDASDGVIKFFKDATTKPTSTVNFSEAGLTYANIKVLGIDATGTVTLPSTTSIGDVSSTEIGYLNGVTSDIQTQISNKQNTVANVSDTEIGYLDGVTSAIQTQLNAKQNTVANVSDTEIGYLDGVTSAIQTQIDAKANNLQSLSTPTFSSNNYTLVIGDKDKVLLASNGSTAGTVTVPPESSVNFTNGTVITVVQTGSGQLTLTQGSGVTINSESSKKKLTGQYASAQLIKTGTDTWLAIGNLAV